jgi:glycosyltransferase involved in cell wall biosynthesis
MIKVSIITINLNNRSGLEKTISSAIGQTYTGIEYIVIDGGSTDGSIDVIQQHRDKITKWVSEKDAGIFNAMNKGLNMANGEYCLFLNSGDYLADPGVIAMVFSKSYTQDILYGELIFDYGNSCKETQGRPEKLDISFLYNDNIWHPATFIKRSLLQSVGGYNERYKIAGGYDFFFNMITVKKVNCLYLPYPITVYDTKGVSSLPGNMSQIIAERVRVHKTYLDEKEIKFLDNLKKYKKPGLSRWLIDRSIAIRIVDLFQRFKHRLSK